MVASKRKAKSRTPGLLSHTRSPHLVTNKTKSGLSAKTTASIIRTHHQLQKAHAQAVKAGETAKAAEIQKQIDANGGLKKYQIASITGQSAERGGDSSRVLVEWLEELRLPGATKATAGVDDGDNASNKFLYNVLEVGALSTTNACSQRRYLAVTRIDLHSQSPGIQQQDFMARPLPKSDADRFDIISLSLVLNYVPDAEGRGDMLRRTCQFLRAPSEHDDAQEQRLPTPCLFFVLPAPCVENSRYLDGRRLLRIMESLGFVLLREKVTSKLVYQLWRWAGRPQGKPQKFAKVEVNPGAKRNNFCVVLK